MSQTRKSMPMLTDPDNIPTRTIDTIGTLALVNGQIYLTLGTNRGGQDSEGRFVDEFIVAARLRLNLEVAKMIRDVLDAQIMRDRAPAAKPN